MATKIKRCTCKHEYQDKKYGKGMRVMNSRLKTRTGTAEFRCTVCERIV